ncbi:MAG: hypothetical protein AAB403_17100 [Planctomycetota bacterium]
MADAIDPSTRTLLKKGLAGIPELQGLSSDQALEVVNEAERLAADEQDVSFYEKATSPRYVLQFAALLLGATILGFVLYWGTYAYIAHTFSLGRGGGRALFLALLAIALGAFYLGRKVYRRQTPRRLRHYVVKVLKRRAVAGSGS